MTSPTATSATTEGFNGIVIARPAIVIPIRDHDIAGTEPRGSPEGGDKGVEVREKGDSVTRNDVGCVTNCMERDLKGTEEQSIMLSPRDKFHVTDTGSTLLSQPRKLPIPNTAANSNSTLKGILIKPKRILPAQPGGGKPLKHGQDNNVTSGGSPREYSDECTQGGLSPSRSNGVELSESPPQLNVTKLQINVDRLKSYFAAPTKGSPTSVNSSYGRGAKSALCKEYDIKLSANLADPVRSHTECANAEHAGLRDGGKDVQVWCSQDYNKMTNNMSAEPSVSKTLERSIRSPSPKSNTTWDRSSSGYSSDERGDPRSPPPTVSSASTACRKVDVMDDDGVSMVNETLDKLGTNNDITDRLVPVIMDNNNGEAVKSVDCNCPIPDVCPHSLGQTAPSSMDKCESCDNNDTNSVASESGTQQPNLQTESQIIPKTVNRRPAWTAGLLNSPASGRIQYRKSGTEPMISLRHPNRQSHVDNTFDGLEVCGKSYPQTTNFTSGKNEPQSVLDVARNEDTSDDRPEITTSAFAMPDRTSGLVSESVNGGNKLDNNATEVIRPKVIRQPLIMTRTMKDIKPMTLNMNVKLNLTRDDKDIRKSLQDLNSPRRQSPGGKSVPIRARHDPTISQSMNSSFTAIQKPTNGGLGKKMWRAPSGLPEHAQMRPFSPFGGTLPPAKLKESERKKHAAE